jgi:hypothetical protein
MKMDELQEQAPKTEKLSAEDLNELRTDFQWCIDRRDDGLWRRQRQNYRARYCIWPGQSEDGRKWKARAGEDGVFPWPGASDARVHLVDNYANEDIALLKLLWRRNRILVSGTETNDAAFGRRLTDVLRWMVHTQMAEARNEMKLVANWMIERGSAVCGVFWDRQTQLAYEDLDGESLLNIANQAQVVLESGELPPDISPEELEGAAALPAMIRDPQQVQQAAEVLARYFPHAKRAALLRAVADLRKSNFAKIVQPYVRRDRPCIVALIANEEVFWPPEATDLQSARAIYRRELLTEAALRERVLSHEWNEAWVNQMVATQRGQMTPTLELAGSRRSYGQNYSQHGLAVASAERLFEVIHAYRRLADEDGVLGIYYTVFNPRLSMTTGQRRQNGYAWHGLLNYAHGDYPFVLFEREKRSRLLDESRGYGEVAATWQDQIKAEWDSRRDRASLATLPPSFHPYGMAPDKWGPGVQIPTNRPADYGFMEPPRHDRGSEEVEATIKKHADRYFGRTVDEQNVVEAQALRQSLGDDWMEGWAGVYSQTLKLMQQFMPDEFYYRVVGSNKGRSMKTSREEIQGQFDAQVVFNVENFYAEKVKEKLELVQQALAWDVGGRVDRDEVLAIGFELIDPNMGERVLKPAQEASVAEIDDEAQVFAKISSGVPVDVRPGQAWQQRLKWLKQMVAQNPTAQKRYQEDEFFRKLLDKRMQQLSHQVEQFSVNAQIGKLGA